jgi:protein arginine N-methyltransferase 1
MNLDAFENPWEHIRLLSDRDRNDALLALLARRAPGARVLEVGCGTGVLSCIAARLGAKHVYAVEPTDLVEEARELVARNGLAKQITVLQGMVQDVKPREVDFAFSELLNADPFEEGVLPAMKAAQRWLVPGGFASPTRLRVHVALVHAPENAREVRDARKELARFGQTYDLDFGGLDRLFRAPGPYKYVAGEVQTASRAATAWDLRVGFDDTPEEAVEVEVIADQAGPIGGAVAWFDAEIDGGERMHNAPGQGGHWGYLVSGWPEEIGVRVGQRVRVRLQRTEEDGLMIEHVR